MFSIFYKSSKVVKSYTSQLYEYNISTLISLTRYVNNSLKFGLSSLATFILQNTKSSKFLENGAIVSIIDWRTVAIKNISVDMEHLYSNIRYSLHPIHCNKLAISDVIISWDKRLQISIDHIDITVDVSENILNKMDNSHKHADNSDSIRSRPTAETLIDDFEIEHETIVVEDLKDAKQVLSAYIDEILKNTLIKIKRIYITAVSDLSMTDNTKHSMTLYVDCITNENMTKWRVSDLTFHICESVPAAIISTFSISINKDNYITADFSQSNNIHFGVCGDACFIVSMFLQQLVENQRILSSRLEKESLNFNVSMDDSVRKNIARNIAEGMSSLIMEKKSEIGNDETNPKIFDIPKLYVKGIYVKHANFTVDIFKGSDLNNTRIRSERFTIKTWGGFLRYDVYTEHLYATVDKAQTTIGYINSMMELDMTNTQGFWNINVTVPDIYIRTSQQVVDKIIILFTFNVVFSEYDLLFNRSDAIKFKRVNISNFNVRFKYYNSPCDYRKVLKGHWKYLVRLIPHCDLSITVPTVILRYQVGWDDLIEAYIKELISTQKLRCAKKVIIGTAKRKFLNFLKKT